MSDLGGPQHVRRETSIDPIPGDPASVGLPGGVSLPVQPAAVQQPVIAVATPVQPVVQSVVQPAGAVQTAYTRSFAPDAVITALVGLALLLLGLIAAVRAGFDGSFKDPVVEVLGLRHTTLLGLIEAGLGACLLIAGVTRSRSAAIFFGLVLGVAAVVGAVQHDSFDDSLALESGHAWLLAAAAAFVVLVSLLLPRFSNRSPGSVRCVDRGRRSGSLLDDLLIGRPRRGVC